jgi:glucose/arabinose dehydrogenase
VKKFILFICFLWMQTSAMPGINRPQQIPFRQEYLRRFEIPDGFKINVFASGLGNPRMMTVAEDGSVYVTRPEQSDVISLKDTNGDGVADEKKVIIDQLQNVHGIAIHNRQLYLCAVHDLYRSDLNGQHLQTLINDLPEGGRHPNRTIHFGPDGMLYISVGSTCNSCQERNAESATILRANPDGSARQIFVKGLRNTIGFDWDPVTKKMWGMDNGSDERGDNVPSEELNQLTKGADYGWPFCYENKKPDPINGAGKEGYCGKTVGSVLGYLAHAAPIEMLFYRADQFPEEYRGDAFVAMHGSWNRTDPSGYRVVRIDFSNGTPVKIQDFISGFLLAGGNNVFGRPAGLAVAKDGSLLISDDTNGQIYRIHFSKGAPASTPALGSVGF